jgi:hypothetical protein
MHDLRCPVGSTRHPSGIGPGSRCALGAGAATSVPLVTCCDDAMIRRSLFLLAAALVFCAAILGGYYGAMWVAGGS